MLKCNFSVTIPRLFEIASIEKCLLTTLESNWCELFEWKFVVKCCVDITAKQVFHVLDRTRTAAKCTKMKNARAKRAKLRILIVKYANL